MSTPLSGADQFCGNKFDRAVTRVVDRGVARFGQRESQRRQNERCAPPQGLGVARVQKKAPSHLRLTTARGVIHVT